MNLPTTNPEGTMKDKTAIRRVLTADHGEVIIDFFGIINESYTDEEFARLVVLSAKAAERSF